MHTMATQYAIDVKTSGNRLTDLFESNSSKKRKIGIDNDIADLQMEVDALKKQVDNHDKTCIAALLKKVEKDTAYIEALEAKLNISH